jgi:hypothetical protein
MDDVRRARHAAGPRPSKELTSTLTDASILAALAQFHAHRLLAGVQYCLFKDTSNPKNLDDAIAEEREAVAAWDRIVTIAGDVYRDDLAFGVHRVGFPHHWKEELPRLRSGLQALEELRKSLPEKSATTLPAAFKGDPPQIELLPVKPAARGADLAISIKRAGGPPIKAVRLRYRHLTQYEDYRTAEMTADPGTNVYHTSIPGAFITREWDLMYFVEVIGDNGIGTIAPDLDREAPYRIVPVVR